MIDTLTSLRIFFALMVFGAHCYVLDSSFDAHFFKEGFVGVSFFFVLSGFIIAYNYQEKLLTKRTDKRTFWVARIARIYPLHLLTLVIAACIGGYVQYNGTVDWIKHFAASTFLLQPFFPSADYFFSFNSPSWSLGCEQLFYFCFPLVIPFLNSRRNLLIALGICLPVMLAGMYLTPDEQIKAYWYVNPITRLPDFFVGVLLYQFYRLLCSKKISYSAGTLLETGVVVLFFLFYLCAADIPKVYRYSCYYWLPVSLMILVFALQKGMLSRLLSNRFLIIGGEISYSFYLIHLFIILTYTKMAAIYQWQIQWTISVPLIFCITVALSLLSYYYFEKPANRWVKRVLTKKQS
ncbi:acyltransferase [uncultured Parabacteroides sp.]|uniref:acyltransferase family protein n=1 Tax=uncultured Parabacteroides sp. TaxID=512312 RepID=UPI0025ED2F62|nr:acyltransferase [uncultured Parabacteroides sp.]